MSRALHAQNQSTASGRAAEHPAQAAADESPLGPVPMEDPTSRLACQLPAPYWLAITRMDMMQQGGGGCAAQRAPENLLFVCQHKDAPVQIAFIRGNEPFLMRNRDDLEAFVNGLVQAIQKQGRGAIADLQTEYREQNAMIVHRMEFTAPAGGAGCAGAGANQQGERVTVMFVEYFVRPEGLDALHFRTMCAAPASVFDRFRPEVEGILSSVRYQDEVAADFFVPDAPEERVPTSKDAARAASTRQGSSMWMLVAVVAVSWFLLRRRKKAQSGPAA